MNCKRTCKAREAQRTEGRTRKKDNISTKRINDKVRLLRREKLTRNREEIKKETKRKTKEGKA